MALLPLLLPLPLAAQTVLSKLLPDQSAADLVPGADAFGPISADLAVAPVLKGGETLAWAFVTSDFVGTTGYSGKPIHTLVALDKDAKIAGVKLVKHSEPIVLIGIPEAKIQAMVDGYLGLDLVAEAKSGGTGHEVEIITASVRTPHHVTQAALMGADIATVPFGALKKCLKHPLTDQGLASFEADWKKVTGEK